jgi:hypothetical protein
MRVFSSTRYVALAALAGALACAGNKARTDEGPQTDETGAARDTTMADTTWRDTTGGRDTLNQNPPGYRGMERDTTQVPPQQPTSSDTFLQNQGQGTPQDTAGYSGVERVDTTGQAGQANPSGQTDTSGYNANPGAAQDTSGMSGMDSTRMHGDSVGANNGASGLDSTGLSKTGDTTGYQPSQQPQDTTTAR